MNVLSIIRCSIVLCLMSFSFTVSQAFAKPNPALSISSQEKQLLMLIRNNVFGGARLDAAFRQATLNGEVPPIFPYEIENRGIIVWELDPEQVQLFASSVGIFPSYTLAKVEPLVVNDSPTNVSQFLAFIESSGLRNLKQLLFPKKFYVIADIGNTSRAEQGAKIEFKTFVKRPGATIQLYRFASYKSHPGTDLLQLFNLSPANIAMEATPQKWSGQLSTNEGSLSWTVDLKVNGANQPRVNKFQYLSQWYLNASERVFGPMGSSARYYYDGSSVSAKFIATKPKTIEVTNSFEWGEFVANKPNIFIFSEKSEFLVQPISTPIQVTSTGVGNCTQVMLSENGSALFANLIGCALTGTPPESVFATLFTVAQSQPQVLSPANLPTLYFALLDLYQGIGVISGIEKPKLFFSLLESPKTIFINFEIAAKKVKEFEDTFLPEQFRMAKMRFYPEQRKAVYAISLNIYQSTGQNLNGYRAEWSTYVINPAEDDPKPRFSVLEAQTNVGGFDPIVALERYIPGMDFSDPETLAQLIEPPSEQFTYSESAETGIQVSLVDSEEDIELEVDISYPPASQLLKTKPTTTWMEANDFVYWGKVADILKYDRQVMFADLLVFEAKPSDLIRDTTFAEYVKPEPLPIIIWNGAQDIALEPWGNLDSLTADD
ncbi:hypothetical protein ACOMICROBIO_FLGHMIGD_03516 [Vibrio sp. B1FLJ16]|uniref:hypothetical protein n=1 Tax=Vibrio sp. B1FLJ16 TaxID=2751178 RepID=UPI0015F3A70E|nr:hypothetical protein [Vibrio sp. B1FLJ16]CAD7817628.1 hypothetical protein ACOMICROBIO_FLGHMIGD_03516 [Vibrio sp. B1FLJ16]CAE6931811.1 hypothetical protein ACOMICROBIO_FLGHMIGD_03516 [Vibrio sp. B1FLJ16]